jgi:heme/copper-type cytochrome/quinol oxidase subunit 4
MTEDEAIEGAKEFLLQEYQSLIALHQEAKAVGETRLNFYVTFVAAVSTVAIALQSFIATQLGVWVIGGIAIILIIIGLITFQKMLQRRVAIVLYRRRISRIRAWFVNYYPPVVTGLPYGINQKSRMDWGKKSRLGSTAFSVAFINTALVMLTILAVGIMSFGLNAAVWVIPFSILAALISWFLHILWKLKWMKNAETRDEKELRELDEIKLTHSQENKQKEK